MHVTEIKPRPNVLRLGKIAAGALLFLFLNSLPCPTGLTVAAMRYIAIFLTTLYFLIVNVAPDFIVLLLAQAAFVLMGVADFNAVFAPYGQSTVWMLVGAFGISAASARTGLLTRMVLWIMQWFPEGFGGQLSALLTTGLLLTPMIPSCNAKITIFAPFALVVCRELGISKGSQGARGMFMATYLPVSVLGHVFYSGSAMVFIGLAVLPNEVSAQFQWLSWLRVTWVWGAVMLLLFVAVLWLFCRSKRDVSLPAGFARSRLQALGPMSREERISALLLGGAVLGWMTESLHQVAPAVVALLAFSGFFITGVVSREGFRTLVAWDVVVLSGGLLSIAALLGALGIDRWISGLLAPAVLPYAKNIELLIVVLCVLVYLMRMIVFSQIAVLSIFYFIFSPVLTAQGVHPWVLMFIIISAGNVWNLSFHNDIAISALEATGHQVVEHRDILPMSVTYMAANIVALLASVPLWRAVGFLR